MLIKPHIKKCRLEFWIVYFKGGTRIFRDLSTVELAANIDAKTFLLESANIRSLDDVKMVNADALLTAKVLDNAKWGYDKLLHAMMDNCNVKQGKSGF